MRRVARPKDRINVGEGSAPLARPFAGLAELRGRLPAGPAVEATAVAATTMPRGPIAAARKIVLRRERKGHAGKVGTRVEGLAASAKDLDAIAGELRRGLGCGAAIDGDDIVLQGDQVDRLVPWFESRGAAKIVVGS